MFKVRKDFIMREVMGEYLVVPVGKAAGELHGIITINDTGAAIWRALQKGATLDQLAEAIVEEFDIDIETARADAEEYIKLLDSHNILEK